MSNNRKILWKVLRTIFHKRKWNPVDEEICRQQRQAIDAEAAWHFDVASHKYRSPPPYNNPYNDPYNGY
jgi:hypothetical protein